MYIYKTQSNHGKEFYFERNIFLPYGWNVICMQMYHWIYENQDQINSFQLMGES